MTRLIDASAWVYGRLLRLCPRELRVEFGEEMTLVFAEDLADSFARGGVVAACRVWLCAGAELARLGAAHALSSRGVVTSLLTSVLTALCFGAELAIARAHGPTPISVAPAYVFVGLVLIVSLIAALVAFVAARFTGDDPPQRLLN